MGRNSIDYIVLNNKYPSRLLAKYEAQGALPVKVDREKLAKLGIKRTVMEDLVSEDELVRHDPNKLAWCILNIAREAVPSSGLAGRMYELEKLRERLTKIGI